MNRILILFISIESDSYPFTSLFYTSSIPYSILSDFITKKKTTDIFILDVVTLPMYNYHIGFSLWSIVKSYVLLSDPFVRHRPSLHKRGMTSKEIVAIEYVDKQNTKWTKWIIIDPTENNIYNFSITLSSSQVSKNLVIFRPIHAK